MMKNNPPSIAEQILLHRNDNAVMLAQQERADCERDLNGVQYWFSDNSGLYVHDEGLMMITEGVHEKP